MQKTLRENAVDLDGFRGRNIDCKGPFKKFVKKIRQKNSLKNSVKRIVRKIHQKHLLTIAYICLHTVGNRKKQNDTKTETYRKNYDDFHLWLKSFFQKLRSSGKLTASLKIVKMLQNNIRLDLNSNLEFSALKSTV